jgi:hypothetical protein
MRALLALAMLGVLGCASAHGADAGPDGGGPHDDDVALLESAWRASCARRYACSALSVLDFPDYEDCDVDAWPLTEALVQDGTLRVDADAVRRCIAGIAALPSCPHDGRRDHDGWAEPVGTMEAEAEAACRSLLVGERPVLCGGATCAPGSVCLSDARCGYVCQPPVAPGEPCPPSEICGGDHVICQGGVCSQLCTDARCRASGGGNVCTLDDECVRVPELGESCVPPSRDCLEPAACDGATCVMRAPAASYGEPCDPPVHACLYGLFCSETEHVCRSLWDTNGVCSVVDPCPPGTFCHSTEPSHATECTSEAVGALCLSRRSQFPGTYYLPHEDCPAGTTCVDDRCAPVVEDGEACSGDDACHHGSRCLDGRCAAVALPWEPCGDAAPCAPWLACVGGRCTRSSGARVGTPCRDGRCDEGVCQGGWCSWRRPGEPCLEGECPRCTAGVCEPYPGATGSVCTTGDECDPALYCTVGIDGPSYCCS